MSGLRDRTDGRVVRVRFVNSKVSVLRKNFLMLDLQRTPKTDFVALVGIHIVDLHIPFDSLVRQLVELEFSLDLQPEERLPFDGPASRL